MAVTISYPDNLPDFRLGKQRQQVQTYRTSQPFTGPLFIEKITDESPVTWRMTVTCSSSVQARIFQAFLRKVQNGETFIKDILTEEGHIAHEVRFIEMPLEPDQSSGSTVWSYTGLIQAIKLVQPDSLIDDDLIILYLEQSNVIDVAVNIKWSEFVEEVNPFARLANPLVHLFTNDKTVEKLTSGTLTTDRATTGTQVSRTTGLIETVAIDTIREESKGYLLEGESTNLILWSEEFDNAAWTKARGAITADSTSSPTGAVIADEFIEDNTNGEHFVEQLSSLTIGNEYTISTFVKASVGARRLFLRVAGLSVSNVTFDLGTKTITSTSGGDFVSAKFEELANGWFRVENTFTAAATGNTIFRLQLQDPATVYIGDGVSGLFYFGTQLEQLPFATSSITTTTTAVTRAADRINFPISENVPINPELSILYTFSRIGSTAATQLSFSSGGTGASDTFSNISVNVVVDYTEVNMSSGLPIINGVEAKVAVTLKSGDSNLYIDSVLKANNTTTITTSISGTNMHIGSNSSGGAPTFMHMSDFMVYDFELTSTEVALIQG